MTQAIISITMPVSGESDMKMHKSITHKRVNDACKRRLTTLDNPGFCIACGEDVEGCEPDAREYECEYCGEPRVYGAEELLFELC